MHKVLYCTHQILNYIYITTIVDNMNTDESIKIAKSFEELPESFKKLTQIDVRSVPNRWYSLLRGEEKHSPNPDYAHILAAHLLHRIVLWYMPVQMSDGRWEYRDTPMLTNYQYYQYAFCVGYKPVDRAFKRLAELNLIMVVDAGMLKNKQHYWVHLNLEKAVEVTEKVQANWRKVQAKLGIGKKSKSYSDTNKDRLKVRLKKDKEAHKNNSNKTAISEQDKKIKVETETVTKETTPTEKTKTPVVKKVVKPKKK